MYVRSRGVIHGSTPNQNRQLIWLLYRATGAACGEDRQRSSKQFAAKSRRQPGQPAVVPHRNEQGVDDERLVGTAFFCPVSQEDLRALAFAPLPTSTVPLQDGSFDKLRMTEVVGGLPDDEGRRPRPILLVSPHFSLSS